MTCKACDRAKQERHCPDYITGCLSCSARALATGRAFFDAQQSQTLTPPYRNALRAIFGERWKAGHRLVRLWAQLISQQRSPAWEQLQRTSKP